MDTSTVAWKPQQTVAELEEEDGDIQGHHPDTNAAPLHTGADALRRFELVRQMMATVPEETGEYRLTKDDYFEVKDRIDQQIEPIPEEEIQDEEVDGLPSGDANEGGLMIELFGEESDADLEGPRVVRAAD